jgi:hypothetical protein
MVEIIKKSDEDQDGRELIESIDLDQIVEGNSIFESRGICQLKVTHAGKIKKISIPIKSRGVSEMIDEFEKNKKPQPPKKRELIKKDSDVGREMKLTKNEYAWVFDFTDEVYLDELQRYNRNLGLKIVMLALDLPIKDAEGNEITDDERKLNILKGMGLTGEHLNQLVKDVQSLTQWQEDRENDFLAS